MKTKSFSILALLIVASMVLAACGTTAVETVIVEVEGETVVVTAVPDAPFVPKVLLYNWLATDTTSVDLDGQLFMGLTNFSVEGEVIPWLATDWSVSDDGLTWTFNLRDDIPWVAYNTGTAEVDLVYDADGNQRFVNATLHHQGCPGCEYGRGRRDGR
jgi:ABC-type transport system substrate-binding protein